MYCEYFNIMSTRYKCIISTVVQILNNTSCFTILILSYYLLIILLSTYHKILTDMSSWIISLSYLQNTMDHQCHESGSYRNFLHLPAFHQENPTGLHENFQVVHQPILNKHHHLIDQQMLPYMCLQQGHPSNVYLRK